MFAPGFKVTRINARPLFPKGLPEISIGSSLKMLRDEVFKRFKEKLRQEAFSPAAKARLIQGMDIKIGKNSVTIVATDPIFRPLLEGRKNRQMTWLTKADRPIPIVLESGEVIFRNATQQSMQNGAWYHPGRKPSTVLEKAKVEAREVVKKRMKQLLLKQLRTMLK